MLYATAELSSQKPNQTPSPRANAPCKARLRMMCLACQYIPKKITAKHDACVKQHQEKMCCYPQPAKAARLCRGTNGPNCGADLKNAASIHSEQPIRRERHLRLHSSSLPPLALSFKSRNPTEVHRIRALLYMEWTCQSNKVVRRLDFAFHCVWPSHGYPKQAVPFAPQA